MAEIESKEGQALDDEYQQKLAEQIQAFERPAPDFPPFPDEVLPLEEDEPEKVEETDES